MNIYYDQGYQARLSGKSKSDNPYIACGCRFKELEWEDGWTMANEDQGGGEAVTALVDAP